MTNQRGFSLIELLIVLTVVGVLAAVAIPAHQDQAIRAQVAEGLGLAASARAAVSKAFQVTGAWPSTNAAADLAAPGGPSSRHVASVGISAGGVVTVTFGGTASPALQARTLALTPAGGPNREVAWLCGAATRTGLPGFAIAADASTPPNGGTLPLKYRPAACR